MAAMGPLEGWTIVTGVARLQRPEPFTPPGALRSDRAPRRVGKGSGLHPSV